MLYSVDNRLQLSASVDKVPFETSVQSFHKIQIEWIRRRDLNYECIIFIEKAEKVPVF